jgi:hypothetical protein
MANSAAGAGAVSAPTQSGGGAQNPFQIATNLYAEQNVQAQFSGAVPASASQQGGSVNAGQYMRGVRLIVRTTTPGVHSTDTAPTTFDQPFSVISNADLVNVDGSEILYNMSAFAHTRVHKYFRPWLQDPDSAYDTYVLGSAGGMLSAAFTLFLQPEIRFTAGVLANTDTRSQYRVDYTVAPVSGTGSPWSASGAYGTAPSISVLPYLDAWAQPDASDLQGTANQPVPPGVNLQNKRRHQIFGGLVTGDNIFLSTLTGNALRGLLMIFRNSTGVRTDPATANTNVYWQLDNRSLGKLNADILRQWASDFYSSIGRAGQNSNSSVGAVNNVAPNATAFPSAAQGPVDFTAGGIPGLYGGAGSFDTGVVVLPRWIEPGVLEGQGWLYSANSTKLQFEFSSLVAGLAAGTMELVSDEVYPVGAIDPSLIDI